ncbi:mRNA triphosphatase CET1 [Hypoxylon sp. FL1284]|nr:mRNA triphosphatase CET1 [Hypoxylon sp. FL1284]
MDLRAMLNGPDGGASKKQPSHPSLQTPSASSTTPTQAPSTPSHGIPPQVFRDFNRAAHIPNAPEYPPSQPNHLNHPNHPSQTPASAGPGPYPSPTSYNPPPNAFTGRPPVPPLQPPSSHDIRSPGSASISGPSPVYRRTPTSSVSNTSGGYPFPPTQQPPASPGQRQYPQSAGPGVGPSGNAYPRDSYNQPQQHASAQYVHGQQQAQSQLPQTPPVGTPGANPPYLHQRSHSIQSTPTPTSAHSQPASYGAPYVQGSPVATHHSPPLLEQQHQQLQHQHQQHQRQLSQPPTPLGQPMPGPPRQSSAASYQQPPSPYQQRISAAPPNSYPTQAQATPIQSSPPPPPPSSVQRMSSSSSRGTYDAVAESHRGSQSRSERERSMSVSPKTRVPSLPSNGGHRPPSASSDSTPHHPQRLPSAALNNNAVEIHNTVTPAKRKLEQRDIGLDELENDRKPPPPPQMNGNHAVPTPTGATAQALNSTTAPRLKRNKYNPCPVWAENIRARQPVKTRNFQLKSYLREHGSTGGPVNGSNLPDAAGSVKVEQTSRYPSPEATRSAGVVKTEEPTANAQEPNLFNGQPFPWEPSISNETPINITSCEVADFLGIRVLQNPHFGEIQSVGAQFEIEAKLGTIIDKMTNDRISFPGVKSGECVLEGGRVAFRSSMTEGQHQALNDYLNEQVKASFPQNPRDHRTAPRVQVHYVHRREVDRFFELPPQMRQRVPPAISSLIQGSAIKARVTHDQKTGNVLAKIVKARVADMNIHFPHLALDCRVSINIEWDWDGTAEEIERYQIPNKERPPDRIKDRLSYKHGFYQIDLTQVTQGQPTSGGQPPQPHPATPKEHELEVELESRALIDHGRMLLRKEPNRYEYLVEGLVNNMRLLARHC